MEEYDDWCNDVWSSQLHWLTRDQSLQIELINASDVDCDTWVRLYAEKYRRIINENPDDTDFQIADRLYRPYLYETKS